MDVLIVGAGPTGLMLALVLAEQGIRFRIIDQAPAPSERSRALVVQARTLELLARLDLAAPLVARGRTSLGLTAFVRRRPAFTLELSDIGVADSPYPFLLFIPQDETEAVLTEGLAARGHRVERGTTFEGCAQDVAGADARLRHADGHVTSVRARFVVGCDGAHSLVRKQAGLDFPGDRYRQDFLLADLDLSWEREDGRLYFFLDEALGLAVFPFKEAGSYRLIAWNARQAPSSDEAADPTLEDFADLARAVCPLPLAMKNPRWLARFRLHHRAASHYRSGRLFVAGDAAHIHSPAGGQGMNTGIQDAANLGWKLALVLRGLADPPLLDSYEAERLPVGRTLLRTTDRLFRLMAASSPMMIAARDYLVPRLAPIALGSAARRARAFRFVSELAIKYPRSPIVREDTKGAGEAFLAAPAAGHRAPDGPLLGIPSGTATTLFRVMADPRHQLLIFPGLDEGAPQRLSTGARQLRAALAADADLVRGIVIIGAGGELPGLAGLLAYRDDEGVVHRRFGAAEGAMYLIRPDGHVALRTPRLDAQALVSYISLVLRPGGPLEPPPLEERANL